MVHSGIAWLRQEFDNLREDRRQRQLLEQTVEEVVDIADPKIRLARRYLKILLPSVTTAVAYCREMVRAIPGPVRLDPVSYNDDPLVKALFPSVYEMENTLRQARNTAIPGQGREIFALLTMDRKEKTIYSHQQHGEMILRDVAMRSVNFDEHRVVAPSTDLEATRHLLEQRALEVLATVAMERISSLRANVAELRERRERLTAMHRMLGGKHRASELFAQPVQADMEKINELKKLLKTTEEEIEQARQVLETPEDMLGQLQRIMAVPADTFVLREQSLRLNWMNVLVEEGGQDEVNEITLAELILNQDLQRSAVLVRFDRQEV
jgi:hypothetical protein